MRELAPSLLMGLGLFACTQDLSVLRPTDGGTLERSDAGPMTLDQGAQGAQDSGAQGLERADSGPRDLGASDLGLDSGFEDAPVITCGVQLAPMIVSQDAPFEAFGVLCVGPSGVGAGVDRPNLYRFELEGPAIDARFIDEPLPRSTSLSIESFLAETPGVPSLFEERDYVVFLEPAVEPTLIASRRWKQRKALELFSFTSTASRIFEGSLAHKHHLYYATRRPDGEAPRLYRYDRERDELVDEGPEPLGVGLQERATDLQLQAVRPDLNEPADIAAGYQVSLSGTPEDALVRVFSPLDGRAYQLQGCQRSFDWTISHDHVAIVLDCGAISRLAIAARGQAQVDVHILWDRDVVLPSRVALTESEVVVLMWLEDEREPILRIFDFAGQELRSMRIHLPRPLDSEHQQPNVMDLVLSRSEQGRPVVGMLLGRRSFSTVPELATTQLRLLRFALP